ncbi:alpha-L-fucosidase [Paludicola sp. MB14-C6]|uniref:alpha-L-fucosidase n=1 Tax=Paludihabitans sp. MB14-C6 TaxID=3070656 RepID=UPI0027DBDBC5|nr:alpha-L-fucosidase [Paludicola sp. MB14-C6]WMJ23551.1 alpha-L-fucosidase [Paludicola sp. MB14-C6]
MFDKEQYSKRIEWYKNARFGMFIHWGIYAIPARGEWVRNQEEISVEDYQQFFDEFNPQDYNPKEWAKICKNAGMKYAVLTAKHHDGFCLFDSKLTDYKSTNTKCGRDLVAEYLAAFREEGIKVGLYYSLLDWHHEDYPHYGDMHHPMRNNVALKDKVHNFDNYLDYMHGQVKELCTNYGQIDIMWFDFSYGDMRAEKWRATELVNMIRSYQPNVIIDNRLEVSGEGFGSLATNNPTVYSGDFVSPEQIIPPNGLLTDAGEPLTWEACITMNNNWGYNAKDTNYKPASTVIKKLVECVSKGGNMLINVGPDANGRIPNQSIAILSEVGNWMKLNHDSIYNCGIATIAKPENGRITRNGNKIYYHILENSIGSVPLYGIKREEVAKIRLLCDGSELKPVESWIVNNYPEIVFVDISSTPYLPDSIDTVVEVTLK